MGEDAAGDLGWNSKRGGLSVERYTNGVYLCCRWGIHCQGQRQHGDKKSEPYYDRTPIALFISFVGLPFILTGHFATSFHVHKVYLK